MTFSEMTLVAIAKNTGPSPPSATRAHRVLIRSGPRFSLAQPVTTGGPHEPCDPQRNTRNRVLPHLRESHVRPMYPRGEGRHLLRRLHRHQPAPVSARGRPATPGLHLGSAACA